MRERFVFIFVAVAAAARVSGDRGSDEVQERVQRWTLSRGTGFFFLFFFLLFFKTKLSDVLADPRLFNRFVASCLTDFNLLLQRAASILNRILSDFSSTVPTLVSCCLFETRRD